LTLDKLRLWGSWYGVFQGHQPGCLGDGGKNAHPAETVPWNCNLDRRGGVVVRFPERRWRNQIRSASDLSPGTYIHVVILGAHIGRNRLTGCESNAYNSIVSSARQCRSSRACSSHHADTLPIGRHWRRNDFIAQSRAPPDSEKPVSPDRFKRLSPQIPELVEPDNRVGSRVPKNSGSGTSVSANFPHMSLATRSSPCIPPYPKRRPPLGLPHSSRPDQIRPLLEIRESVSLWHSIPRQPQPSAEPVCASPMNRLPPFTRWVYTGFHFLMDEIGGSCVKGC